MGYVSIIWTVSPLTIKISALHDSSGNEWKYSLPFSVTCKKSLSRSGRLFASSTFFNDWSAVKFLFCGGTQEHLFVKLVVSAFATKVKRPRDIVNKFDLSILGY